MRLELLAPDEVHDALIMSDNNFELAAFQRRWDNYTEEFSD